MHKNIIKDGIIHRFHRTKRMICTWIQIKHNIIVTQTHLISQIWWAFGIIGKITFQIVFWSFNLADFFLDLLTFLPWQWTSFIIQGSFRNRFFFAFNYFFCFTRHFRLTHHFWCFVLLYICCLYKVFSLFICKCLSHWH